MEVRKRGVDSGCRGGRRVRKGISLDHSLDDVEHHNDVPTQARPSIGHSYAVGVDQLDQLQPRVGPQLTLCYSQRKIYLHLHLQLLILVPLMQQNYYKLSRWAE